MIINKDNRYFHVTPKQNIDSILANGLIAQIGERSEEIGESQEAIYLFPNFEEMNNALANWLGECFEDIDELIILQIDLPKGFPIYKEMDSNGDEFYEVHCTCNIPEEYITAIYDEEYNLLNRNLEKVKQINYDYER